MGDSSAPVQILEFVDYQCPSCSSQGLVLDSLLSAGTRLGIRILNYPLPTHALAFDAARAAVCSKKSDRFVAFHRLLTHDIDEIGRKSWSEFAREAGIDDIEGFVSCLTESSTDSAVNADIATAKSLGIRGTPLTLVNGWRYDGAIPTVQLVGIIDDVANGRPPRAALAPLSAPMEKNVVSGGIRRLRYKQSDLDSAFRLELTKLPISVLGLEGSDGMYDLTNAHRAVFLSDRRLAVLSSRGMPGLYLFRTDGRLERSLAKRGFGPNEFSGLSDIALVNGDSLVAIDQANDKLSYISTITGGMREVRLRGALPGAVFRVAGSLPSKTLVVHSGNGTVKAGRPTERVFDGSMMVGLLPPQKPYSEVSRVRDMEFISTQAKGKTRLEYVRLSPLAHVATWDSLIVTGNARSYLLNVADARGNPFASIEVERSRRALTSRMRKVAVARELERNRTDVPEVAGPPRAGWEDAVENAPYPDSLPAFEMIASSPDGLLWVVDAIAPGDEQWTATAFRLDGTIVGVLHGREQGIPMAFGRERVAIRSFDDDGRTIIRVYGIQATKR
ncbi:MAG: thioredoxin domain-containing protein [Gemmatimonadaceae bacterium]|nr:thioredoxin domain-containing protein [Gemmatimonadaceae bacterium]